MTSHVPSEVGFSTESMTETSRDIRTFGRMWDWRAYFLDVSQDARGAAGRPYPKQYVNKVQP